MTTPAARPSGAVLLESLLTVGVSLVPRGALTKASAAVQLLTAAAVLGQYLLGVAEGTQPLPTATSMPLDLAVGALLAGNGAQGLGLRRALPETPTGS